MNGGRRRSCPNLGRTGTRRVIIRNLITSLEESSKLFEKLSDRSGYFNNQRFIAYNLQHLGQVAQALVLMRQVIDFTRSTNDRARLAVDLHSLGTSLIFVGAYQEALAPLLESLELAQELGRLLETTFVNTVLGMYGQMTAQYELARHYQGRALALARAHNFKREEAATLWSMGCVALAENKPREARVLSWKARKSTRS